MDGASGGGRAAGRLLGRRRRGRRERAALPPAPDPRSFAALAAAQGAIPEGRALAVSGGSLVGDFRGERHDPAEDILTAFLDTPDYDMSSLEGEFAAAR